MTDRLSAEDRRAAIVAVADAMLGELGYMPLPLAALSQRAGVSRALIYARFPGPYDLINAVIERHLDLLAAAGIEAAASAKPLERAAVRSAEIYARHIAEHGPSLHVAFRERFMRGHVDPALAHRRERLFRALARSVRRELRLSAADTVAAIQMVLTIPEEGGRLAHDGALTVEEALSLVLRLLRSSIDSLRLNEGG